VQGLVQALLVDILVGRGRQVMYQACRASDYRGRCKIDYLRNRGSTLPCLIRTYVNRQLGAKMCRKMFTFICLTFCLRLARNRPLGKAQSHLQGVLRRDARTRPTCTLNVQQNRSCISPLAVFSLFPPRGTPRARVVTFF
jgi:hypothetical protein